MSNLINIKFGDKTIPCVTTEVGTPNGTAEKESIYFGIIGGFIGVIDSIKKMKAKSTLIFNMSGFCARVTINNSDLEDWMQSGAKVEVVFGKSTTIRLIHPAP